MPVRSPQMAQFELKIVRSCHSLFSRFLPAVPPDILDDESSSDTLAKEGMHIMLNCRARGNPAPTISWVRVDGKPIRICSRSILYVSYD